MSPCQDGARCVSAVVYIHSAVFGEQIVVHLRVRVDRHVVVGDLGKRPSGNRVFHEFDGRAAFGYHGEKWSWNMVLKAGYSFIHYKEYLEHKFVSSLEILVVRRF